MGYKIDKFELRNEIQKILWVIDKESRDTIRFIFNNVQNKYYDEMTLRDIILKARQQGFSTLILAIWLMACIIGEGVSAVVISHEKEATKRLFARVKFFIENITLRPYLKKESESELSFPGTNSRFYIGTAGARAFGHGDTITHLHCSEYSRWKNPELLTGLLEAVPQSGRVVIETTANGYGDAFHQMWERAQSPSSVWQPHFFGWQDCETNRRQPPAGFTPTPEERKLSKKWKLDSRQTYWRRWKISSMERPDLFPQQHPMTDIEAFIKSGTNIFEPIILQRWYEKNSKFTRGYLEEVEKNIRYIEDGQGKLKIYEGPKDTEYAIGVDTMEGIEIEGLSELQAEDVRRKRDWNVAVVKDRQTWEQVAIYRSQEEPDIFAKEIAHLGRFYGNAILCVEDNVGATVLYVLSKEEKYPNLWEREEYDEDGVKQTKKLGFRTTVRSKKILIDLQEKSIRDNSTNIKDRVAIREHLAYMRTPEGKMTAPSGMNDDCVIADALATMVCQRTSYEPRDEERPQFRRNRGRGRT